MGEDWGEGLKILNERIKSLFNPKVFVVIFLVIYYMFNPLSGLSDQPSLSQSPCNDEPEVMTDGDLSEIKLLILFLRV